VLIDERSRVVLPVTPGLRVVPLPIEEPVRSDVAPVPVAPERGAPVVPVVPVFCGAFALVPPGEVPGECNGLP
jgi:hypothetical protein